MPTDESRQSDLFQRDITDALIGLRNGAVDAADRLMRLVYNDLRRIARRQLAAERTGHTLSPTALVHEAFLRLVDQDRVKWNDRAQFFAVASRAMRRILVDYARRYRALRRGGDQRRYSLDDAELGEIALAERADELVALDEALERLAQLNPRSAQVVELRFFGGLTEELIARMLDVTPRTVARDWALARGWLYAQLRGDAS